MGQRLLPDHWRKPLPAFSPEMLRALRVVVLGPCYADSFADNIAATFVRMGARTTVVDPRGLLAWDPIGGRARRLLPYVLEVNKRSHTARRFVEIPVVRALQSADPDFVLSTDGYLAPETVERWRACTPRATWALWYPDSMANLGAQAAFSAPWDHLFFKDRYLVDLLLSRTTLPAHYLPQACNPERHRPEEFSGPEERARYECDVALAGNMYPYRSRVLETLPDGVDLRLYGNLSRRERSDRVRSSFQGEYVTGRAKALAFRGAKIVLNTMHYGEIRSVNVRLFEATGCGAFVITHDIPSLPELYNRGQEVVAVDSAPELRDAVLHYLGDDEARHRIACAGQIRAHRDHTYEHRLQALLAVCGARA
jgi:spore maturation protein CgeB